MMSSCDSNQSMFDMPIDVMRPDPVVHRYRLHVAKFRLEGQRIKALEHGFTLTTAPMQRSELAFLVKEWITYHPRPEWQLDIFVISEVDHHLDLGDILHG